MKSVSFAGFGETKSCCKKGKTMKRGCCHNVHLAFKKSGEDQRVLQAIPVLAHVIELPREPHFYVSESEYFVPREIVSGTKAPPPEVFPRVIIRNCVFRI